MPIPTALTIAGSDSGGGAGIQADLKTFAALRVHGTSALTLVTAQNSIQVSRLELIDPAMVVAQIQAVLTDFDVRAIKIGALGGAPIIRAVAEALAGCTMPVVLDPVMVAKTGDTLLSQAAVATLIETLVPRAALLTPNIAEAAVLTGTPPATTAGELLAQGEALLALGAACVMLKGGHGTGADSVDYLVAPGAAPLRMSAPRIATRNTHGTGCTLSAAIAAHLAHGLDLMDSVQLGKLFVQGAIEHADSLDLGQAGAGPVHHFHRLWPTAGRD